MTPLEQEMLAAPIMRAQVIGLCDWFEGGGSAGMMAGLRELGLEVED